MKDLIVPDIHGRVFWKSILPFLQSDEYEKVIFLGDYVDPYTYEGYDWHDAIKALIDVIHIKQKNFNKIELLLGNHDLGYIDPNINTCRRDYRNAYIIRSLLLEYNSYFNLLYEKSCNSKTYNRVIYSHAGITSSFYSILRNKLDIDENTVVSEINKMWHSREEFYFLIKRLLSYIGWPRGGEDISGSFVWADACEYDWDISAIPNVYQVFGHTQQGGQIPKIGITGACLDTKRVFEINYETLEFKAINGTS